MSGAIDDRKWSAKCRNWNISDIFNRGAKAAEMVTNIYAVYGDNAIGESTARKLFSRSNEDRFNEDRFKFSSGRPLGFDEDRLNTLIHNDLRQCTR